MPTDVDKKVAELIVPEIPDGACLQLGIGGMPNTVGALIADSDLKDLGVHTEMYVDAFVDIALAGKITGKAMIGGTNWTFKADAISSVELPISDATATFCAFTTNFAISAVATAGKATLPLAISIASFAFPDLPASATSRGVGKLFKLVH